MDESTLRFEEIAALAGKLSPQDKLRLISEVAATLKDDIVERGKAPLRSLYGLCTDLGPAPSAEEIDEVRREIWANFPREDI